MSVVYTLVSLSNSSLEVPLSTGMLDTRQQPVLRQTLMVGQPANSDSRVETVWCRHNSHVSGVGGPKRFHTFDIMIIQHPPTRFVCGGGLLRLL